MKYTKENIEKRKNRVEIVKKFFTTIIYIILIPVIFYNVMVIVKAATNSSKTPGVLGIKTFVIISGSMEPSLDIGDVVVIKEVPEEKLQKGDIISFRSGEAVVTHRINKIETDENGVRKYETKGDNNNISDQSFVTFEDIEGKLVNKIPEIGNVTLLLQNKLLIIIILIIFYIVYLHNANVEEKRFIRKEKRRIYKDKYVKK